METAMTSEAEKLVELDWHPMTEKPEAACVLLFFAADGGVGCEFPEESYAVGSFEPCQTVEAGYGPCCEGTFDWGDEMEQPTHWARLDWPWKLKDRLALRARALQPFTSP
jgi:hypothetical protein